MTRFGFISTYPPTRCGLATFTESLARALTGPRDEPASIVRMLDEDEAAGQVPEDVGRIVATVRTDDTDARSLRAAARALDGCDVVILQHEYGIFGGDDGEQAIGLLEALGVPTIVIFHTVLAAPTPHQREVLERVAALASASVVMTDHALGILSTTYDVDLSRVTVIPHGVAASSGHPHHDRGPVARVLTWGLLSPGKGIERGIRALALLRTRGVDAEYVIAGETHPKVRARSGETYREELAGLARALGVDDAVHFVDKYLTDADLADLLGSADAVLLPYESHEQATSGVLVEAVAAGIPVVATAFPHAVELLTDDEVEGAAVAHDDLIGMADALGSSLMRAPAASEVPPGSRGRTGTGLTWPEVGAQFAALAQRLRRRQAA